MSWVSLGNGVQVCSEEIAMVMTSINIASEKMLDYTVVIDYCNHQGKRSLRQIRPLKVEFKATQWHPEAQWIVEAFDLDKGEHRSFAMADIIHWRKPPPITVSE